MIRRLLVCGDRNWTDSQFLFHALDSLPNLPELVIHGGCRGADLMAGDWAVSRGVPVLPFPADWERLGKRAGPVRNQQMIDEGNPDFGVSFHDELSRSTGTKDMMDRLSKAKLTIWHFAHGRSSGSPICLVKIEPRKGFF